MTTGRPLFVGMLFALVAFLATIVASLLLGTAVTRANFRRLQLGMSPGQVEKLFGETGEPWMPMGGSDRGNEIRLMWTGEGNAQLLFYAESGLVEKVWREPGFASPKKELFDRVQIGMTPADVASIIGEPLNSPYWGPTKHEVGRPKPEIKHTKLCDIDGCGHIDFAMERVCSRSWLSGVEDIPMVRDSLFRRLLRRIGLH